MDSAQNLTANVSGRERSLQNLKPFKVGDLPNPGGRPAKSRNRLQGKFFRELAEDFDKHGKKAIVRCREDDPVAYIKCIAYLMPKELAITSPLDEIPEEQLDAAIAAVRAILAAADTRSTQSRVVSEQQATRVPAVPEAG